MYPPSSLRWRVIKCHESISSNSPNPILVFLTFVMGLIGWYIIKCTVENPMHVSELRCLQISRKQDGMGYDLKHTIGSSKWKFFQHSFSFSHVLKPMHLQWCFPMFLLPFPMWVPPRGSQGCILPPILGLLAWMCYRAILLEHYFSR